MERIWEFSGETKVSFGIELKRIRLKVDCRWGSKDDVGGWIENESNLYGNAWVYGNAQVSGNAHVADNALVYGNARVSGNAHVADNALVSGNARVSGNAHVADNALVYGNARVSGNAQVSGDAQVYGDAQVSGNAWVSGDARVYGNAQVSGDARETKPVTNICGLLWPVTFWSNGIIVIGCQKHTAKVWSKFSDSQIESMDKDALEFWKKHKKAILALAEIVADEVNTKERV